MVSGFFVMLVTLSTIYKITETNKQTILRPLITDHKRINMFDKLSHVFLFFIITVLNLLQR